MTRVAKLFGAVLVCTLHAPQQLRGQSSNVPEDAKVIVVRIDSYYGEGTTSEVAAGIIFGATNAELYVATARHVVKRDAVARSIWVVFSSRDSVQAVSAPRTSTTLDLAVLRVGGDPARVQRWTPRSWDRLGSVRSLRSDDPVSPVGCPQGVCWQAPAPADRIVGIDRLGILFQSSFVRLGSSGGALFNAWWEVVGMITADAPPRANAIPIDEVLEEVRALGFPVRLTRPSIPRSGYRTSIGIVALSPTSASGAAATRTGIPSGRVTIARQVLPAVSWHVAGMRLTPRNLAITAGMAGVGLQVKRGRFALHPYVEVGFGQVEGRHDLGGYYVAAPSGTRYVPLWNRVVADGLGIGGGMNVEVVVLPRTIVELTTGYWSFTTPVDAPKLTNLFIGAGVRLGL